MKKLLLAVLVLIVSLPVLARDSRQVIAYADAMNMPAAKEKLNGDIQFFFGDQKFPAVERKMAEYTSNKKTNALNKSDQEACQWVFLSAMVSLRDRAIREGGNAVVNIHSYYKKNELSSATEFECGAGTFVAGVALRGTVVKLK